MASSSASKFDADKAVNSSQLKLNLGLSYIHAKHMFSCAKEMILYTFEKNGFVSISTCSHTLVSWLFAGCTWKILQIPHARTPPKFEEYIVYDHKIFSVNCSQPVERTKILHAGGLDAPSNDEYNHLKPTIGGYSKLLMEIHFPDGKIQNKPAEMRPLVKFREVATLTSLAPITRKHGCCMYALSVCCDQLNDALDLKVHEKGWKFEIINHM